MHGKCHTSAPRGTVGMLESGSIGSVQPGQVAMPVHASGLSASVAAMAAAGLTWVFDSQFGDVTIDAPAGREATSSRRVMVNSAGGARLYSRASTSPLRKLRDASYGAVEGTWVIEGINEATGEAETWTVKVVAARSSCGSCG